MASLLGQPLLDVLPEEILSSILIEEVSRTEFNHTEWDRLMKGWTRRVALTTVCRQWRRIALDYPTFWTGFYLRPQYKGLFDMLPRWKQYPRKVSIDPHPQTETPKLLEFWRDMERLVTPGEQLEELGVSIRGKHIFDHMGELFVVLSQHTQPTLRTLSLASSYSFGALNIPTHIFTAYTQNLQHLRLSVCTVDWTSLASKNGSNAGISNLLSLQLDSPNPPPPSDILDSILTSSPNLQRLHLTHSLAVDFSPTFRWPKPSLQYLYIGEHGDLEPALSLYYWILGMPFPPRQDMRLHYRVSSGGDIPDSAHNRQLITKALNSFTTFISKSALIGKRPLELRNERGYGLVTLRERVDEDRYECHSLMGLPWFPSIASSLIREIYVPEITILSFIACGEYTKEDWLYFLGRHPRVEVLEISRPQTLEILLPFLIPNTEGNTDSSQSLVFPKLRKITLIRTRINGWSTSNIPDLLTKALVSRREIGAQVKTLAFVHCYGEERDNTLADMRKRIPSEVTEIVHKDTNGNTWPWRY